MKCFLVLIVFHNLKFSFTYIKHYCIYLHFNSRLSKIRHSTQRLLVFECRKATHVWVGCRKSDTPLSACSYSNFGKRITCESVVQNPTFDSALARIQMSESDSRLSRLKKNPTFDHVEKPTRVESNYFAHHCIKYTSCPEMSWREFVDLI